MSRSTRWTIAMLIVVAALIVALAMQLGDRSSPAGTGGPVADREQRDADAAQALAAPRARANLKPCPPAARQPGPVPLQGIVVECAADGSTVEVAKAVAGRTVILNLWAYWCGPCVDELPAMAEYQQRVGPGVTVVTVHQDKNETAALLRLADLGVRLPTFQDDRRLVAAALKVPNVMPATVVLRPDGSVAQILPRSFANADEIMAAIDRGQE